MRRNQRIACGSDKRIASCHYIGEVPRKRATRLWGLRMQQQGDKAGISTMAEQVTSLGTVSFNLARWERPIKSLKHRFTISNSRSTLMFTNDGVASPKLGDIIASSRSVPFFCFLRIKFCTSGVVAKNNRLSFAVLRLRRWNAGSRRISPGRICGSRTVWILATMSFGA